MACIGQLLSRLAGFNIFRITRLGHLALIVIAQSLNVKRVFDCSDNINRRTIYLSTHPAQLKSDKLLLAESAFCMLVGTTVARGAKLSYVLSLFPVLAAVLVAFTHCHIAVDHAIALLRKLARGLFSVARLCFSPSLILTRVDAAAA